MRTRTLLLLAIVVTVVPVGMQGLLAHRPPVLAATAHPPLPALRALQVVRRWDRRRSRAWTQGDPAALARLYVPGSRSGAADVDALLRWTGRGLRVTGLRQQVSAVHVVGRASGWVVVVVTERTVGGRAVHGRRSAPLPVGPWSTHQVRLERSSGDWRVAEVSEQAQPAR